MKILVCMKQVPQKDAPLKLNEAGTWIREDVSYEVNEPDAFALERGQRAARPPGSHARPHGRMVAQAAARRPQIGG